LLITTVLNQFYQDALCLLVLASSSYAHGSLYPDSYL
jgi:hypothetical protein